MGVGNRFEVKSIVVVVVETQFPRVLLSRRIITNRRSRHYPSSGLIVDLSQLLSRYHAQSLETMVHLILLSTYIFKDSSCLQLFFLTTQQTNGRSSHRNLFKFLNQIILDPNVRHLVEGITTWSTIAILRPLGGTTVQTGSLKLCFLFFLSRMAKQSFFFSCCCRRRRYSPSASLNPQSNKSLRRQDWQY